MSNCSCCNDQRGEKPSSPSLFRDLHFTGLLFSLILAIPIEIFSLMDYHLPLGVEIFLFSALILTWGRWVFIGGLQSLFLGNFANVELLMSLAIFGALYLGHLPEAMIIILLYCLGEELEDYGVEKSQQAIKDLLQKLPKQAEIKGEENPLPLEEIRVGSILIIRPGSQIALDGEVVKGGSWVDEAPITGEPIPRSKEVGSPVYAGTANTSGYLEVKVTKESKDTTLAKIIELTYQAGEFKSSSQRVLEKFASIYTPMVMVLAVAVVALPVLLWQGDFNHWLIQGISLLLISCPCALVISTPVAIYSALGNATSQGALIKGGKYLEEMGPIKAIGFDKTRTLTEGRLSVTDVIHLNGFSQKELLACAAGMESQSEHPIAQSILDKAREEKLEFHGFQNFEAAPGQGLMGECTVCSEPNHRLGTLTFIREEGEDEMAPEILHQVEAFEKQGKTTLVMSENRKVKGIIALKDVVRPESSSVIRELLDLGVEPFLLSGDNSFAVEEVSQALGIENFRGALLPEGKRDEVVKLLKDRGRVAMVGDGINDAPSLAAASVGVALGAVGSDLAIENANIALMQDNLKLIPYLIRLGRKTLKTIWLNLFLAVGIKVFFLVLALLGRSHIVLAIFADVGVTVLVVLISLRLFYFKNLSEGK